MSKVRPPIYNLLLQIYVLLWSLAYIKFDANIHVLSLYQGPNLVYM